VVLTVADIDRWDPSAVLDVFVGAQQRAAVAEDASHGLGQLSAFDTWGGSAADVARASVGTTRVDLDAHSREAMVVAQAAKVAADDVERVKAHLAQLRSDAESLGMEIDPVTDTVVQGPSFSGNPMELLLKTQQLQPRLDAIIGEATGVDAELANAVMMADGQMPIPMAPPGSENSEKQIQSIVDDMLDDQDLDPTERQKMADALKDQLRQSAARGLSADQASANAENFAATYMATTMHRSYIRKATRLGTFADADRTATGDFLSRSTGAVIPAARDEHGNLIWVDELTGKRVAEGTPGAMTIPERGDYHMGHQFGEENWRVLRQAAEEGWTQQELNDFMNQHERYRLETPAENFGHGFEDKGSYVANPEWTPQRIKDLLASGGAATAPSIGAPPNIPPVLTHPPQPVPSFQPGSPAPAAIIPPAAPNPGLPPWLTGPTATPGYNPLTGPFGVNADSLPAPAPGAASPPSTSSTGPLININQPAAEAGAAAGGVAAVLSALGGILSFIVHPTEALTP
jgi:hypothetical protein